MTEFQTQQHAHNLLMTKNWIDSYRIKSFKNQIGSDWENRKWQEMQLNVILVGCVTLLILNTSLFDYFKNKLESN